MESEEVRLQEWKEGDGEDESESGESVHLVLLKLAMEWKLRCSSDSLERSGEESSWCGDWGDFGDENVSDWSGFENEMSGRTTSQNNPEQSSAEEEETETAGRDADHSESAPERSEGADSYRSGEEADQVAQAKWEGVEGEAERERGDPASGLNLKIWIRADPNGYTQIYTARHDDMIQL
ncbi:hypothetical protein BLNAU_10058 [Blattamonas nauphoetae]|uniref:Uncharacterized protein n=1 Tax=Blattamonas nauphoetae TaxID=2049346 RepID=A0ABQ9XTW8_9EUKA|nr:hypothetical protein BLNAU_10058 [Blattamonas nauphoetae]